MEARIITALDINKKPDLFAIYENLNESFLDLTFKNLGGSSSCNRHEHTTQTQTPTITESRAFSFPKPDEGEERGEEVNEGLCEATTPSPPGGKYNGMRVNGRIKLNQVIKHDGGGGIKENPDGDQYEVLKRALTDGAGGGTGKKTSLGDVLGASMTMKSPSVVRAHRRRQGAEAAAGEMRHSNGGQQQLQQGADDAEMAMRTPLRSRTPPPQRSSNRCASCNKFILFFNRIRCSDCSRWFCTKCAKKSSVEGNKCKECSFGRLRASRRSKEQQGKEGSYPTRKDIYTNLTSSRKHSQRHNSKQPLPKGRSTGHQSPYHKDSHRTPPLSPIQSPKRNSYHAPQTRASTRTPSQSPRRHSFYKA
ncbi:hypothetical protein GOP47_0019682 [Adiantum capillus-veneris]|uniref:Uncharacterized protein n=1 Tax=Adiantum capillus-veneris TaxID=13818 RepID=A0A9D4Z8V1_ADICA|nr:hypothetical protein GOP47_0019682 [Adiantum capillus-veneris]